MNQRDHLLDQVRRLALRGMGERQTDGQLLELFISERDESAFALLLRRHGAMVWSVCRRVLGNAHDADDAFQAAFLVLVRKADSIRPRESVGNWLYGVAHRTALEARRRIARRRAKEQSLRDVPLPESKPEEPWHELGPILDRELSRLSDKYRLPIVLCDLEGRSRKEVARQLAIPEGTLSSRLNTGRKKLAARLARYGFTISAAALGALLTEKTAMASLSLSLLSATTKAALVIAASPNTAGLVSATVSTLTEGVLKTMFIAKIKTATLVLCGVAALGAGTGGVYYQTHVGAADTPRDVQSDRTKAIREPERSTEDWRRITEELKKQLTAERHKGRAKEIELSELRNSMAELRDEIAVKLAQIDAIKQQAAAREKTWREVLARQERTQVPPIRDPGKPVLDPALKEKIEAIKDLLNREFRGQSKPLQARLNELDANQKTLQIQRKRLDEQLKTLQAQRQRLEADRIKLLEAYKAEYENLGDTRHKFVREKLPDLPKTKSEQKPASGDKLDQILHRLDRLEKRLDRLEKSKQ